MAFQRKENSSAKAFHTGRGAFAYTSSIFYSCAVSCEIIQSFMNQISISHNSDREMLQSVPAYKRCPEKTQLCLFRWLRRNSPPNPLPVTIPYLRAHPQKRILRRRDSPTTSIDMSRHRRVRKGRLRETDCLLQFLFHTPMRRLWRNTTVD